MAEAHWLTIIGLGEDGPAGLAPASRKALDAAEVIMGPERHLAMVPEGSAERVTWPVPFSEGLPVLQGLRGRRVVVLASGDPFWFGLGRVIAESFAPDEWRALPGRSCFSLAAARLGWPLETTLCMGLHAAPFARLRPRIAPGQRALVTLRDGRAVEALAAWLTEAGFGDTQLSVCEALGGARERMREAVANSFSLIEVAHPVCVGLSFAGDGASLTCATGQADDAFESDGQITKRPVRAITLSTLAPKPGERLWDIGAGSGSVALEWLLSHPACEAVAVEARADRVQRIKANALSLGQDRLMVVEGAALEVVAGLPTPDAVFLGGGLTDALLDRLWSCLAPGTRLVANAVTLDTAALLTEAQAKHGGRLLKIELAEAEPIGRFRGWKSAYPVVQWSVTR